MGKNFNPIIVLFLTGAVNSLSRFCFLYFNPIIVLFLTLVARLRTSDNRIFQSYYSLIFNLKVWIV